MNNHDLHIEKLLFLSLTGWNYNNCQSFNKNERASQELQDNSIKHFLEESWMALRSAYNTTIGTDYLNVWDQK